MMPGRGHLRAVDDPPRDDTQHGGGGGNGGRYDVLAERVRLVELDIRDIKTRMETVATKSDIDKLKIWALVGGLIGAVAVIGWLVRLIMNSGAAPGG